MFRVSYGGGGTLGSPPPDQVSSCPQKFEVVYNCLTRVNYRVYNEVEAKTVVAKVTVNLGLSHISDAYRSYYD